MVMLMKCPKCNIENLRGTTNCYMCGEDLKMANVEYAGFWRRFVAYIIDVIIIYFTSLLCGLILLFIIAIPLRPLLGKEYLSIVFIFSICIDLIIYFGYFTLSESSKKQATVGKQLLHVVVSDAEGNRLTKKRALLRNLLKIASAIPLDLGFIMIGFMPKKQGLHDILAGAIAMKKN